MLVDGGSVRDQGQVVWVSMCDGLSKGRWKGAAGGRDASQASGVIVWIYVRVFRTRCEGEKIMRAVLLWRCLFRGHQEGAN